MTDAHIGSLSLQIEASSKDAASSITELQKQLRSLNSAVGKATALQSYAKGLADLGRAAAQLSAFGDLERVANSIQKLNGVKLSKTIATNLQALSTSLSGLDATNLGALNSLAAALAPISTVDTKGFNSTLRSLGKLPPALAELQNIDLGAAEGVLGQLSTLFSGLQGASKEGGFNATISSLKKLPTALADLQNIDIAAIAPQLDEIAKAIRPLADEMAKIGTAAPVVSKGFAYMGNAAQRAATGTNVFGRALNRIFSYAFVRRAYNVLGGLIDRSTQYVEDLNLFTVAMGEYAEEAQKYAETVSEAMGIDVAQWLRGQGVFKTLASGFGVTSDRAAIMSKNLTQLAYDLSSFYNLSVDDAFQKLQSGFAGEIEPVRRLGYDLSKTNLQATAASLGITKLLADMTQAEKSQLRYYALMTQVTQVQGDMARTLNAPANQLRVLRAQLEMAGRSLGNIFIPLLNKVLPYLIAAAKFVRMLADEVARFFGFELPQIDYSDVGSGVPSVTDDVEDLDGALGGAAKRAKEVKNLLAGFDELNIIQAEVGGGGGGGGAGADDLNGGWKDFELPQYDFLKDAVNGKVDAILAKWKKQLEKLKPVIKWIKDNFDKILDVLKAIGLALLAWKVSSSALNFLQSLGMLKGLNVPKIALGLSLMVGGFSFAFSGWKEIGNGSADLWSYLKAGIGSALGIGGSLLVFGVTPLGWTIGITTAIGIAIAGIFIGHEERLRAEIEEVFFNGVGKPITEIASQFNNDMNAVTLRFTPLIEAGDSIKGLDKDVQAASVAMSGLFMSLEEGTVITPQKVEELLGSFNTLYLGMEEKLGQVNGLIRDSLVTAMQNAATDVGLSTDRILGELARITGKEEQRLRDLKAQGDTLIQGLAGMVVGSDEYNAAIEQLGKLTAEMASLTGVMNPALGSWSRLKEEFSRGVNFQSVDDAKAAIESMNSSATEAKEAIEASFRQVDDYLLQKIEHSKKYAPEELEFWREYRIKNKQAFEAEKSSIDADYENMANQLQVGLNEHLLDVMRDIDSDDALAYSAAAERTVNAFTKPIEEEMQAGFDALGIDGKTWASDSALSIIDGLTKRMWDGKLHPDLALSLDELNAALGTEFKYMPQAALEYFKRGLDESLPDSVRAMTDAGSDLADGFGNELTSRTDAHLRQAKFDVESTINGIAGLEGIAGDAGTKLGNSMGSNFTNALTLRTNETGRRLSKWWKNLRPNGGDPTNPFNWGELHIEPFAAGGFPRKGSLFLAGEAGPEIVSTMGGQTAVANTDQIVSGIAYGVSLGNAEETRLMREIVNICAQLLAKGGNVVFSPSAEAGSVISRSLDMYSTQRGY